MNSTKQHIFPGYPEYAAMFEYAAQIEAKFSASFCQNLLEQIENYAQEAQELPAIKKALMETRMMLGEMMDSLRIVPYKNKAEREARTVLLERAGKVLNSDVRNDAQATGRAEVAQ